MVPLRHGTFIRYGTVPALQLLFIVLVQCGADTNTKSRMHLNIEAGILGPVA